MSERKDERTQFQLMLELIHDLDQVLALSHYASDAPPNNIEPLCFRTVHQASVFASIFGQLDPLVALPNIELQPEARLVVEDVIKKFIRDLVALARANNVYMETKG